jgi:hypothetical protein
MEQSPKFEESTATYIINAHGVMLTTRFTDNDRWFSTVTKKYHAINIPKNVELYTFANLGNCLAAYEAEADFLCNIHPDKHKLTLRKSINPAFKFTHQHGEANKFPELLLTPERNFPVGFYTGILHCIPEALRKTDSLGKEVIYNISAKNTKDCECSSILLKEHAEAYDCDTKYSNYYKEQLRGYKYNPATNINEDLGVIQPQGNVLRSYKYSPATKYNINKCGPILLSEALEVIQTHCNTYYKSNCVIQIYIIACLEEEDLLTLVRRFTESYNIAEELVRQGSPKLYSTEEPMPKFISTEETSQKACLVSNSPQFCFAKLLPTQDYVSSDEKALDKLLATIVPPPPRPNSHPPRPNSIQPLSVDSIIASLLDSSKEKDTKEKKKNIGRMEHYYEAMNHNTFAKVNKQNVVASLSDFKGTPLTKPLYDTHIFMYNAKVFNIKTFKDAFIEFNGVYDDKFTGTIQEREKKREQKYRALSKKKLHSQLLTALQRFNVKHDDDDLYYDNGVIIPTELDILPKTNEINLALPFNISTTSEYLPTNMAEIIYTQLLRLIALEKAKKLGQGRKTLRNKGKKGKKNKKPKSQKAKKPEKTKKNTTLRI